ncbi:MAG TPA: hypothetical protein PKD91_03310 [Bacteroidia bacterium]|nr:hypothetical protein [Bacteroidia bacterium]
MKKFKNRYRIKSTRLPNWNYAGTGKYFITICTKNREKYFGEIVDGVMISNDLGKEVERQWLLTPSIRPDMNLTLDEFQVMPNHFHGIIEFGWNKHNKLQVHNYLSNGLKDSDGTKNIFSNTFGPQRKNLGSVIRGFKSSVTTFARKNKIRFNWQPKFHDVIIRDDIALNKIRKYIRNNPANWGKDRFRK